MIFVTIVLWNYLEQPANQGKKQKIYPLKRVWLPLKVNHNWCVCVYLSIFCIIAGICKEKLKNQL